MQPELREHLARALAAHLRPGQAGEPTPADFELADVAIGVLEALTPPTLTLDFSECGLGPEQQAAWFAAYEQAADQPPTGPLHIAPEPVHLERRSPAERLRYLTEHRSEALARGIPEELIDLIIAEAEGA